MLEPFILTGKAKDVFRWIELRAKLEAELNLAMKNLSIEVKRTTGQVCRFSPNVKCSRPDIETCLQETCDIWQGKLGSEEFKEEKDD